jgi:hypothetical protein
MLGRPVPHHNPLDLPLRSGDAELQFQPVGVALRLGELALNDPLVVG